MHGISFLQFHSENTKWLFLASARLKILSCTPYSFTPSITHEDVTHMRFVCLWFDNTYREYRTNYHIFALFFRYWKDGPSKDQVDFQEKYLLIQAENVTKLLTFRRILKATYTIWRHNLKMKRIFKVANAIWRHNLKISCV